MQRADNSTNSAIGFRPAKHYGWVIGIFHFLNALDLAWHNRLRIDPDDLEILKNIPMDSGLILTANHSDEMDPKVVFELSRLCHRRFTFMINSEAFEEFHGLIGWFLQHLGGFSVERGGNDQMARSYAVEVIKNDSDALVMFPEGEISYLNDLVQPFKTGVIHMDLQAIAEARKTRPLWTAYLLPLAIKYRYRKPIGSILDKKIRAIEKHLLIRASFFTLQVKIIRIMAKILKRQTLINRTRTVSGKITQLKAQLHKVQAALLTKIRIKYPQLKIDPQTLLVDRAQKIIFFLREQLSRKELFGLKSRIQFQKDIKDLKETIQMAGWQPQYIGLAPSEERLAEIVMKLEREVFNLKRPRPLGNRDVFVRIGNPLDLSGYVEAYRKDPSAISHRLAEELRDNTQSLIEKELKKGTPH